MFELRPFNCDIDSRLACRSKTNYHQLLHQSVLGLFDAARRRAAIEQVKRFILGHMCCLFDLGDLPASQVRSRHYGGIRSVNINQICGSMSRTGDFDHHFHPLNDRLRDRWVSVAAARCQGAALPAVRLVQVGGCYFVEDGHHRLSVAGALGETAIDAEVMVWDVSGPLPWERQAQQTGLQPVLRPA